MNSHSIEHLIEEYTSPLWITPNVSIRFDLDIDRTVVRSEYEIAYNGPDEIFPLPPLFLNGEGLTFLSLRLDGAICEPLQYQISDEGLFLRTPPSKSFQLIVENSICPKRNTSLEGLYHSGSMLCTQNEPEGFRKITYSIDRPDNPTKFKVTLCGDKSLFPILLSNGNQIASRDFGEGKQEVVWEDPFPKPSYLFAIVAGDLVAKTDVYTTKSGKKIDLKIYVDRNNLNKTDFAMLALKEAMLWDEETFGLEYDLDLYMIVAVDDFNMGAMENKGLNLFNSKLVLADKLSATDETFESILAVVAHEYFHNWTGNRVTLKNWFNLTLKEGLTVFRDQWFTEDKTDVSVKRIKDVMLLIEHQFPEDAGPMAHPILPKSYVEMNNFYTVTVYEKGAEVIRMLSLLIGRELFKKGLIHYLKTYDGQAVSYEEFVSSMEFVSGKDLKVFRNWYDRKGTPNITMSEKWDEVNGNYTIQMRDIEENQIPLHYPVEVALFDSSGSIIAEEVLELKGHFLEHSWNQLKEKPILSPFRRFSSPIKLSFPRNVSELSFLAKYEKDGFSKFFALQEVVLYELNQMFYGNQKMDFESIITIFRENLRNRDSLPKDFLSYLLALPGLNQLAEKFQIFNFVELEKIRKTLLINIANNLTTEFQELYAENFKSLASQNREQIGKRKLKNTALYYLFHAENMKDKIGDMALRQQTDANHMSEELSVLRYFCETNVTKKEKSISLFYDKWKKDPLVLDYWFSAQVSTSADALVVAQNLSSSKDFNWQNPNRVRALIGAFARNNVSFHKSDGSGYLFLSKALEKLNDINPQIASNLGKLFQSVRLQENKQKQIAKKEMERLLEMKNLSRDLGEVLGKIVKGL